MSNRQWGRYFLSEEQLYQLLDLGVADVVIPFSVKDHSEHYVYSIIWICGNQLVGTTFEPHTRSWCDQAIERLANPVTTDWEESLWAGDISFRGEDVNKARFVVEQVSERANELYPGTVIPRREMMKHELQDATDPSKCDCANISSDSVQITPSEYTELDHRVFVCIECGRPHGLLIGGKRHSLSDIFDENWILAEYPDDIIETGENDQYLAYSTGNQITRTERVVEVMRLQVALEVPQSSDYELPDQQALVCFHKGEAAGYLTWISISDGNLVRQLYVRESHRQQGIAHTLAATWVDRFCSGNEYWLDDPNQIGRAVFESVEDDRQPIELIELHPYHIEKPRNYFWQDIATQYGLPRPSEI